jgi:hypothetical protein
MAITKCGKGRDLEKKKIGIAKSSSVYKSRNKFEKRFAGKRRI